MTARFQNFLFKWSVAAAAIAFVEVGQAAKPALVAVSGALQSFTG